MEAKDLVGKWIVADLAAVTLNQSGNDVFRVVGYVPDMNLIIVDAKRWGRKGLIPGDVVIEKCETYWYMRPADIIEVL